DCGYPDCFGYSNAIAQGKDASPDKCAPGGADSKAMLETILVSLKTGKLPEAPAAAPEAGAEAKAPAQAPAPGGDAAPSGPPLVASYPPRTPVLCGLNGFAFWGRRLSGPLVFLFLVAAFGVLLLLGYLLGAVAGRFLMDAANRAVPYFKVTAGVF